MAKPRSPSPTLPPSLQAATTCPAYKQGGKWILSILLGPCSPECHYPKH